MVLPIFVAAESAAKGSISGEPVQADISYGTHTVLLQQHDALRPGAWLTSMLGCQDQVSPMSQLTLASG